MPHVYASVYAIGTPVGPQKIGVSYQPETRRARLQRTSSGPLQVNHFREYERQIAFRIESIIKRKLASIHLGNEWYSIEPRAAALAIGIAERVCFDIELPIVGRGTVLEARRCRLGLTKRALAALLGIAERQFQVAYSAALLGKPPPHVPDILDRVQDVVVALEALPASPPPEKAP